MDLARFEKTKAKLREADSRLLELERELREALDAEDRSEERNAELEEEVCACGILLIQSFGVCFGVLGFEEVGA